MRVVCNYYDVEEVADALLAQDDVKLIERKDYINHPKESGYRSLHLVVSVPVYLSDKRREVPVEVQIRTIAMDFWASLEHRLRYKNRAVLEAHGPDVESIRKRLVICASQIALIDQSMQQIQLGIDALRAEQEEALFAEVESVCRAEETASAPELVGADGAQSRVELPAGREADPQPGVRRMRKNGADASVFQMPWRMPDGRQVPHLQAQRADIDADGRPEQDLARHDGSGEVHPAAHVGLRDAPGDGVRVAQVPQAEQQRGDQQRPAAALGCTARHRAEYQLQTRPQIPAEQRLLEQRGGEGGAGELRPNERVCRILPLNRVAANSRANAASANDAPRPMHTLPVVVLRQPADMHAAAGGRTRAPPPSSAGTTRCARARWQAGDGSRAEGELTEWSSARAGAWRAAQPCAPQAPCGLRYCGTPSAPMRLTSILDSASGPNRPTDPRSRLPSPTALKLCQFSRPSRPKANNRPARRDPNAGTTECRATRSPVCRRLLLGSDDLEAAHVGAQHLGHGHGAVGVLVVLDDRGHRCRTAGRCR